MVVLIITLVRLDSNSCTWDGPIEKCDISCKQDSDCKFSLSKCVNINEEVSLPRDINPMYMEYTCKCENNICVNDQSTGEAII